MTTIEDIWRYMKISKLSAPIPLKKWQHLLCESFHSAELQVPPGAEAPKTSMPTKASASAIGKSICQFLSSESSVNLWNLSDVFWCSIWVLSDLQWILGFSDQPITVRLGICYSKAPHELTPAGSAGGLWGWKLCKVSIMCMCWLENMQWFLVQFHVTASTLILGTSAGSNSDL